MKTPVLLDVIAPSSIIEELTYSGVIWIFAGVLVLAAIAITLAVLIRKKKK